jgi:hypothetical protein
MSAMLGATRFDSRHFGHETAANGSLAKTAGTIAIPLGTAALSSLCVLLMTSVDYPWFAAGGLAVAYTLFWFSLSPAQLRECSFLR